MSNNTVVRGLGAILTGGADFITFEEGKPVTLLFIDWFEDLLGIREHFESALNPKYVRCPGKDVCPLCHANPGKYPALRIKFRVYEPNENKIKFVSLAKSHVKKINDEMNLDEVDPTKNYVTIYRSGKGASDTSYTIRRYIADIEKGKPIIPYPSQKVIEGMPDVTPQVTPHTPDEIAGFMQSLVDDVTQNNINQGGNIYGQQPQYGQQQQPQQSQYIQPPYYGQQQVPNGSQLQTAPIKQRSLPF